VTITRPRTKLAINRLRERRPLDAETIDRFLARHEIPIVEGNRCTFLYRGAADEVWVRHAVLGLPHLGMRRIPDTELWYVTVELPAGSRVEYQIEIRSGDSWHRFNDPLNPRLARSPVGDSSVCYAAGYERPDWTLPDPEARPGQLVELVLQSQALRRDCKIVLYLPARYQMAARYPLLVVHDGGDFLEYGSAKTVLDNLIHRLDVAELVAAFTFPMNRLVEYANYAPHARFLTAELVPRLEAELPLAAKPAGRCLLGSSFGAVAALSTAVRSPETYGSLFLQSGSFVHTDIGEEHGGGPVFDPVVKFTNRYRARPTRVADRIFQTCGVYEPLVVPNRSMATTFREAGMDVRYVEARDGHNWENWRDRWRDGLSWIFPGPQKFVYE
jgi:enterochelin esterase-like enzyme